MFAYQMSEDLSVLIAVVTILVVAAFYLFPNTAYAAWAKVTGNLPRKGNFFFGLAIAGLFAPNFAATNPGSALTRFFSLVVILAVFGLVMKIWFGRRSAENISAQEGPGSALGFWGPIIGFFVLTVGIFAPMVINPDAVLSNIQNHWLVKLIVGIAQWITGG